MSTKTKQIRIVKAGSTGQVLHIEAANGVPFAVKIVERGHVESIYQPDEAAIVKFYDERYPFDQVDEHTKAQFTGASYYADTLVGDEPDGEVFGYEERYPHGLRLDGGVPNWTVDRDSMETVLAWVRANTEVVTW